MAKSKRARTDLAPVLPSSDWIDPVQRRELGERAKSLLVEGLASEIVRHESGPSALRASIVWNAATKTQTIVTLEDRHATSYADMVRSGGVTTEFAVMQLPEPESTARLADNAYRAMLSGGGSDDEK